LTNPFIAFIIIYTTIKTRMCVMRNAPSLELWERLYTAMENFKKAKPWEKHWDADIFRIAVDNLDEDLFCSILGRNGDCMALAIYLGSNGLKSYIDLSKGRISDSQLMHVQDAILCYIGDREELYKSDLKVIKDLGRKYRGRNEWVYFRRFEPGFVPCELCDIECRLAAIALEKVLELVDAVWAKKITPKFEEGLVPYAFLDNGEYNISLSQLEVPQNKVLFIQDELLMQRLKKSKKNKSEIEIDAFYFATPIKDKHDERAYYPRMFLIADAKQGLIINQDMYQGKDNDADVIINHLIEYITNYGCPKKIHIRNEDVFSIIVHLCEELKIELIPGCNVIEHIEESLMNSMI
jgi:hypothetical protein